MKQNIMKIRNVSQLGVATLSLVGLTVLSASILSKVTLSAHADDHIDIVSVTVPASCNVSGYIDTENDKQHSATIANGLYQTDIGETVVTVSCNDNDGYSVYAIGYGEDTDGVTTMKGTNTNLTIPTGTVTDASVSNWAMKLTAVSGTFTPTILSDNDGSCAGYHVIPATATKVVTYTNSTNLSSESQFKTTYAIGISNTQPADTYTGKVKFTLVHPNYANADGTIPTTINDLTYMQEFATLTNSEKVEVLTSMTTGQQYQLKDNRDQKDYYISRLADGNVWMTQNLDHDIVTTTDFYTYANTDIGHGSTPNTQATWTASTATYATGVTTWGTGTTGNTTPQSYDPGNVCWSGTTKDSTTVSCNQNGSHFHLGNFYNWTAAVAMNNSGSYYTDQQDVDQSICPAGWTLPKDGSITTSGSFQYLVTQYGWDSDDEMMTGDYSMWSSPLYFPLSGRWSGSLVFVGYFGYYWSSVVANSNGAYTPYYVHDGDVDPDDSLLRNDGYSVRCLAR